MPGLRVFLSSTATDLVAYRQIADDTLLRLKQQSVIMERFGALPGAPVAECERLAASSDLVVCSRSAVAPCSASGTGAALVGLTAQAG